MRFDTLPMRTALMLPLLAAPHWAFADGPGLVVSEPAVAPPTYYADTGNQFRFTAGLGVISRPGYFGSADNEIGATGSFSFEYLRFAGQEVGARDPNVDPTGLSIGGSLRYIGERTAADYPELVGLGDVDLSLEVGAGITYRQPNYEAFADVRYGAIGHEGWVGEVGVDVIVRPSDQLTLSVGPRAFWGSDAYADTYFSVDSAAASPLEGYDANGGLISAGVEVGADYQFNDTWGLRGTVRWDQYLGDAADSPLVTGGSDTGVTASLLATRSFTLDF